MERIPDPDNSWRLAANCYEADTDEFFRSKASQAAAIVKFCRTCNVVEQCVSLAIRTETTYGVYGGLTERQLKDKIKYLDKISRAS